MWKRKSISTVQETQVRNSWVPPATSSVSEPEPTATATASASSIRQYDITSVSSWTRQFKVKEKASRKVIYTLAMGTTSFQDWGMVLTSGDPSQADPAHVAAAAKVSLFRSITHLVVGNPSLIPDPSIRVEMKLDSKWKHNKYSMTLPLSTGHVLDMQWKGTNEVQGFMKKMDRGMHHKLVQVGSNRLLATYVHNPWSVDVAGTVEIYVDIPSIAPQWWDLFVLVSALAVAEKTLKMVKMSMHGVDDSGGMVEAVSGGAEMVGAGASQASAR